MAKIIGIDLGTTNSVVAVIEGKDPKVVVNEEGDRVTPSVVAFTDNGETLVGQIAKRQAVTNPTATIASAKRFMGRRFDEVSEETQHVPYEVVKRENGGAGFKVRGERKAPPEISAQVLRKLKRAAENHLGHEVREAVITVPAYFDDAQRQATKDAGKIAGLEVRRIINEPTAAALAYGLDKRDSELIAVYDFGGGTFDVSVLEVGDNVVQVISTAGDTHLGGDDVDRVLIDHLIAIFKKDTGIDVSGDRMVLQRLKDAAEKAKIELSSKLETEIHLPFLTADANGPKHLNARVSRSQLESMIETLVEKTFAACKRALKDAGKSSGDVDEVVLVGGSTRIPLVIDRVTKFFGKEPHRGVNPDEVVALGAAVQGGVLAGDVDDVVLLDVTPLSLGVETLGGVMTALIPRNTTIPATKEEIFSTAEDNQPRVDIHVLQGERTQAIDNRTLGRFHLEGIEPAPRGVPKVKVKFDIDANGILSVTATDQASGKDQSITVTANSGLNEGEIAKMVADAEAHAAEDQKRRAQVELRNRAEQLAYASDRALNEVREQADPQTVATTEEAIKQLRDAVQTGDAEAIEKAVEHLEAANERLRASAQAGAPEDSGVHRRPMGDDDDIIDADYEEAN